MFVSVFGPDAAASIVASNVYSAALVDYSVAKKWNLSIARFLTDRTVELTFPNSVANLIENSTSIRYGRRRSSVDFETTISPTIYPFMYIVFVAIATVFPDFFQCKNTAKLYKLIAWAWLNNTSAIIADEGN